MTRVLLPTLLVIACTGCSESAIASATSDQLAQLDSVAAWYRTNRTIPSLSVTVLRDGEVVAHRDYGSVTGAVADDAHPRGRVYGLGSIKKTATAVAVFHLVQHSALKLSDPVSDHAPSVQLTADGPTVEQLLRHTSGFPQSSDDDPVTRLDFTPGSKWEYNNANFDKLDEVIATASGRSFDELLAIDLEAPDLGMCEGGRAPVGVLPGHQVADSEPRASEGPCWFFGSTRALAEWVNAVFAGDVIPLSAIDDMVVPTHVAGLPVPFGAGVALRPLRGVRRWSHTGHDNGSTASFGYYPDHGLTVVVAGNSDGFWDPDGFEMAVAELFLPVEPAPAEPSAATSIEPGIFRAGPVTFRLGTSDEGSADLTMEATGEPDMVYVRTQLRPVGPERFVGVDSSNAVEAVVRMVDGRRTLEVHIVGVPWTATEI